MDIQFFFSFKVVNSFEGYNDWTDPISLLLQYKNKTYRIVCNARKKRRLVPDEMEINETEIIIRWKLQIERKHSRKLINQIPIE